MVGNIHAIATIPLNFLEFFELDNCHRYSEGIYSAYSLIKTARLFHIYFCNLLNNNIF